VSFSRSLEAAPLSKILVANWIFERAPTGKGRLIEPYPANIRPFLSYPLFPFHPWALEALGKGFRGGGI